MDIIQGHLLRHPHKNHAIMNNSLMQMSTQEMYITVTLEPRESGIGYIILYQREMMLKLRPIYGYSVVIHFHIFITGWFSICLVDWCKDVYMEFVQRMF